MTAIAQTDNRQFASLYVAIGGSGPLYRLGRRIVRMLAIRQLRQALRAMPDWLLHEIGVNRSDIDNVAVRVVDGEASLF